MLSAMGIKIQVTEPNGRANPRRVILDMSPNDAKELMHVLGETPEGGPKDPVQIIFNLLKAKLGDPS